MEQKYLRDFEARCTQEEPPACRSMCPLHVEAREFACLMAVERLDEARKILERSMPLAGLAAFLCPGHCREHCRRSEVDAGVNLPMLERACLLYTRSTKPMPMPASGKTAAVAGGGFSSLCLAYELGKKGFRVNLYHQQDIAAAFAALPPRTFPERSLGEALEQLAALRVSFEQVKDFSPDRIASLRGEKILYLGLDDPDLDPAAFGLAGPGDPLTLESPVPGLFAGGAGLSFIQAAAAGKRAAGSIVRFLQGVAPSSAREGEDIYPTKLITDLSAVAPLPPPDPADPLVPTREEAKAEAARCIPCDCLLCVKKCAYLSHYESYPKRYGREFYNTLALKFGNRRSNIQIISCALCGLCGVVCPNGADMGSFCLEARREMAQSRHMPVSAHEFALEDMAYSNSAEVAFYRPQPGRKRCRTAFFPGCRLPSSLPEQTGRLYTFLTEHLDGGVGLFYRCCGAPARWSGRERLTAANAAGLREIWEEAGGPELILACPSCALFFASELADIPVKSLWEILPGLPLPKQARPLKQSLALHDPCAARARPDLIRAVRDLAGALGQETEELPLGRDLTRCCGYGGLASAVNPELGAEIALSRARDTDKDLLCWCIMCRDSLSAVGKGALHFLDLLFPAGDEARVRPAPGISLRQERALAFRREMLQNIWNEKPDEEGDLDPINIEMDAEVAERLERRRILLSDLKRVLLYAGEKGGQFYNPQTGRTLSSLRPKQVTFWVEYSPRADGVFVVHNAYCHRMLVPGTPGEGLPTAAVLEGFDPRGGRA
ncbi:MAG: 4Fe-4S dicluster domain-containing protein [Desulfovibrio sp.]|jgi:Fe-S oxidoreductase|nr:4Fe-4S dicluster domain-containing protein [Desulfovibrio sp.]